MNNTMLGAIMAHSNALVLGMGRIRYQRFAAYCIGTWISRSLDHM